MSQFPDPPHYTGSISSERAAAWCPCHGGPGHGAGSAEAPSYPSDLEGISINKDEFFAVPDRPLHTAGGRNGASPRINGILGTKRKQTEILNVGCFDVTWWRSSISRAPREYSKQSIGIESRPCWGADWHQELRRHNILGWLNAESALSQRRKKKKQMKKLWCGISIAFPTTPPFC